MPISIDEVDSWGLAVTLKPLRYSPYLFSRVATIFFMIESANFTLLKFGGLNYYLVRSCGEKWDANSEQARALIPVHAVYE